MFIKEIKGYLYVKLKKNRLKKNKKSQLDWKHPEYLSSDDLVYNEQGF